MITLLGITKARESNSIEFNWCSLKCWIDRQVANKGNSTNFNAKNDKTKDSNMKTFKAEEKKLLGNSEWNLNFYFENKNLSFW